MNCFWKILLGLAVLTVSESVRAMPLGLRMALWNRSSRTARSYPVEEVLSPLAWTVCTNDMALVKGYDDSTAAGGRSVKLSTADSSIAWIETVSTNACRVTFDWKCSCEPLVKGRPYDYMQFSADGIQKAFICGDTDWTNMTFDVAGMGEHSLRWSYVKDESDLSGEDCAWIANVTVVPMPPQTFGEYLNSPGRTFTTGGDAEWVRAKGESDDGYALRSGAITHSQTSRLETVVYGAGTVAFSCKVDGEVLKKIAYDGLAFCIDGVRQGDLMGDNEWREKSFTVSGDGRHTLSWLYVKDEDGSGDGEDCAWLDNVVWTADDPLPPLDVVATDNDAKAVIAGLSDVRLAGEIGGTAAYSTFRDWVDGNGLSHALVRDAPNAWLSYVLDAPGLMAKAALTSEDVVIESIAPSGTVAGAFDLVVDIAGTKIGTSARLADALGVEGATVLDESAFSSDGLTVTLERTAEGKIKATVTPAALPSAFFLRVKVK